MSAGDRCRASLHGYDDVIERGVGEGFVVLLGTEIDLDPAGSDHDHVIVVHRMMAVRGDTDVNVEQRSPARRRESGTTKRLTVGGVEMCSEEKLEA